MKHRKAYWKSFTDFNGGGMENSKFMRIENIDDFPMLNEYQLRIGKKMLVCFLREKETT